jgi:hypothetical protein
MESNSFDKHKIKTQLQTGVALVSFNKKDGTLRSMKCTLQPSLIPQLKPISESKSVDNPNSDCLKVYDLEASGWRSFNMSNVISIFETNE